MMRRMSEPTFIILYVDDPLRSAAFYGSLLGKEPVESAPTFAMFALANGTMLGLWSRHTVEPAATVPPGGSEICFVAGSDDEVTAMHRDWTTRGLPMLQPPTRMDFGYTFTAADPDGHRLRVFAV